VERLLYRRPGAPAGASCRLVAVGDLMLSGGVRRRYPGAAGADEAFAAVAPILRSGDIVFGNLETPLCAPRPGRELFRGDPAMAGPLSRAGFTVLSLANNHILEYGPGGLQETRRVVAAAGMLPLGAGGTQEEASQPVEIEAQGLRIGLLGFGRTLQRQDDPEVPGFVEWDEGLAMRSVAALRDRVDCVIISIHIGLMWLDYPKPEFKEIADRLLAAGAHVVLMHHAHVLQGYGVEGGRAAVYNLGNFVADVFEGELGVPPVPEKQRESAIFIMEIDKEGVRTIAVVPIQVTDDYRVVPAVETEARRIIDHLEAVSLDIRLDRYREAFTRQRASLNTGNLLSWLWIHLRKGHWRELTSNMSRARPEHLVMLGRFAMHRLAALWRRS
jgi:poly-gamma-glutamate synthesis protein (capsule biosynthesis protein)